MRIKHVNKWVVTHPKGPGIRLIGWDCGDDVLSLPGGTYTDVQVRRSDGWVWKRFRWWHRVFR